MPFLRSDLYFEQILILYVNFFNVIKLNLAWPKYVSELWDHLLLELWRLKWLYCLGQGGCFVFSYFRLEIIAMLKFFTACTISYWLTSEIQCLHINWVISCKCDCKNTKLRKFWHQISSPPSSYSGFFLNR